MYALSEDFDHVTFSKWLPSSGKIDASFAIVFL